MESTVRCNCSEQIKPTDDAPARRPPRPATPVRRVGRRARRPGLPARAPRLRGRAGASSQARPPSPPPSPSQGSVASCCPGASTWSAAALWVVAAAVFEGALVLRLGRLRGGSRRVILLVEGIVIAASGLYIAAGLKVALVPAGQRHRRDGPAPPRPRAPLVRARARRAPGGVAGDPGHPLQRLRPSRPQRGQGDPADRLPRRRRRACVRRGRRRCPGRSPRPARGDRPPTKLPSPKATHPRAS